MAAGLHDHFDGVFGFGFSTTSFQNLLLVDGICGSNLDKANSIPKRSQAALILLRCIP